MSTTVGIEIVSYVVTYFGGAKRAKRPYKYRAIISLHDGAKQFATLYFHDMEESLPQSDKLTDLAGISSHYTMSDLPHIVDLLRNEKPMYFHKYMQWPTMGIISTSKEPVGEAE